MSMRLRQGEFERIRSVVEETDADEPLTARAILELAESRGEDFDSAHQIATVLGRRADTDQVEVIRDQPYRYRFPDVGN